MFLIRERNRLVLQMRKDGIQRKEVARKFKLSPSRTQPIEKQDAAHRSMAEKRVKLREEIRTADDMERLWLWRGSDSTY